MATGSTMGAGPQQRDSTSEYVRELKLSARGILYVATNRGVLHRVRLPGAATLTYFQSQLTKTV